MQCYKEGYSYMTKLQYVLDTIKEIECPIDQWENKAIEAYKEYANDDEYEISIDRAETLDSTGTRAYRLYSNEPEHKEIVILVSEGSEGYVANIEDVYVR